jgi:hypothetical protein
MSDYESSLPVRTENDGDVVAKIADATTPANQWEIDATGRGKVNVADSTGDELEINADGSINVNMISTTVGDDVHEYNTEVAGVPNTPATVIDYTVSSGKTLILKQLQASASGKAKVELLTGTASSEVNKYTSFISTSSGEVRITFAQPIEVAGDDKVLLIITNTDKANADLYGLINGVEV